MREIPWNALLVLIRSRWENISVSANPAIAILIVLVGYVSYVTAKR